MLIIYGGVLISHIRRCLMTDLLSTKANKKVTLTKVEYLRGSNFFAAKREKDKRTNVDKCFKVSFSGMSREDHL